MTIMTDEDRSLTTLVEELYSLVCFVWSIVKLVLSSSYFCGKFLTHGIASTCWIIWDGFCGAADFLKALLDALIELEESFIRFVFLIQYGIGQLYDAFCITLSDLHDFTCKVGKSHVTLLDSAVSLGLHSLKALVFTVPSHLCLALSTVGDSAVHVFWKSVSILSSVCAFLCGLPLSVALAFRYVCVTAVTLPVQALGAVPVPAYIGLVTCVLAYTTYRRISLIRLCYMISRSVRFLVRKFVQLPCLLLEIVLVVLGRKTLITNNKTSQDRPPVQGLCIVCQENSVSYLANPCSHVCLCDTCVDLIIQYDTRCPMCRDHVDHYSKVFVA